mgnify:CR=1 FL=1
MYFWGLISNYNPKIEKNTQTLSLEKNVIAYNKIHKIEYNQNIVEGDIVFICIVCKKLYYADLLLDCLLYTSPSPRDGLLSRMPSSA